MVLENINWKEFRVGDLFDAESGNTDIKKKDINGKGYPVISSGVANQGLIGYSDIESKIHGKDTITVDMFGNVFYRDFDYKMVTHARVFALIPKRKINPRIGNFLVTCILKITDIFEYSYMCSYNKLKDMTILLPATQTGEPDWEFMEEYISEIEKEYLELKEAETNKEINTYFEVSGLDDYELTDEDKEILSLSEKTAYYEDGYSKDFDGIWLREFRVGDLFEIKKGKRLTKQNMTEGNTVFIGSTSYNNGQTASIGQEPIFEGNCISVSYNGSVGESFYQSESFWASDDINVLYLKNHELNELLGLYLCTVLKQIGKSYEYSRKWNLKRMKDDTIFLPVREDGQPDWEFMERYIKVIEKIAVKDAVEWKNSELNALKGFVI